MIQSENRISVLIGVGALGGNSVVRGATRVLLRFFFRNDKSKDVPLHTREGATSGNLFVARWVVRAARREPCAPEAPHKRARTKVTK